MHGTFQNNLAFIEFKLRGTESGALEHTFQGMIDTGFNGYLQVPLMAALPVGLKLVGLNQSTIANGSQTTSLGCEGRITICGEVFDTFVSLPTDGPILIGTQLLAKLGKDLHIDFVKGTYTFKDKPKKMQP